MSKSNFQKQKSDQLPSFQRQSDFNFARNIAFSLRVLSNHSEGLKFIMDLDSGLYNNLNGAQRRDATETMKKILEETTEKIGIILDIGCASGNVTALLAETIPHEKIIALDVDPSMIEFSKKHISSTSFPTIQFLLQDISAPWDELHPLLKSIEGRTSLVWSNRVLHWIPEEYRERASENIVRFLKPGGRLYINTTLQVDINQFLPSAEREANELFIKVPSLEDQMEGWRHCFSHNELSASSPQIEFIRNGWTFDNSEQFWSFLKVMKIYRRYLRKEVPEEKKEEVLMQFWDLIARVTATPVGEAPVPSSENLVNWYYGQFRITATKD